MKIGKILLGALLVSSLIASGANADFTLFEIQSGNGTGTAPFNNGINDSFAKNVFAGVSVTPAMSATPTASNIAPGNGDGPLQRGGGLSFLSSDTNGSIFTVNGVDQTSIANARNNNDFVSLAFSMPNGTRNLTSISANFTDLSPGTVGAAIEFSSNTGAAFQVAAVNNSTGTGNVTLTADLTQLTNTQGITSGTFRFLFWSSSADTNPGTAFFTNNLAGTSSISVIAVPEPSSIALLSLIGTGAVGIVAYRRKKAKKAA